MTQDEALSILTTGANAFLSGEPGSGKTHTIRTYIDWLKSRAIEPAITASTGVAATHVGGMTIHAWSGIGVKERLSGADLDAILSKEQVVRRITKTSVLIIDEISMLSGNTLSMIDTVMREARRNTQPFGGVQMVFVGDFFQLPPVSKGNNVEFAFESSAWREANPLSLYLTEQHRHEDKVLGNILKNMRQGACDHSDISRICEREAVETDVPDDVPRLYTHNIDVDRINEERLKALPGKASIFVMEGSGAPMLVEALKRGCLSPEVLELKVGATVMSTKNNPALGVVNGTLGKVTGFVRGSGLPVVALTDGREVVFEKNEWVVEENGKQRAKIVQVPLRLAWAITVHKSQGQSLDAAAIDLSRAFEYGQGYVALSRLRTLSGLHLLGFSENALSMHPRVQSADTLFQEASLEAARVFGDLTESGERSVLEENFVRAAGGSTTPGVKTKAMSTYDKTLELMKKGVTLSAIAKDRGLTLGTIADHVEHLVKTDKLSKRELRSLIPERVSKALPDIFSAFEKTGHERLAPAFSLLKKRFDFPELKMARALYTPEE